MANRHFPHPTAHSAPDMLEALLDKQRLHGRKAIHAPKPEKIYFDADRLRWLLAQPSPCETLFEAQMCEQPPRSRAEWREWLDYRMKQDKWDCES